MATKQLYDLGDMPPLGEVPEKMHAFFSSAGTVWRSN